MGGGAEMVDDALGLRRRPGAVESFDDDETAWAHARRLTMPAANKPAAAANAKAAQ